MTEAMDHRLREAAKAAGAHEFITDLRTATTRKSVSAASSSRGASASG